jgi:uncharacterized membrane protein YccC
VRGSLALEAGRPQWLAGLRTATALMVPLLAGYLLHRSEMVWAALGGWLTMLADPGGTYRARAAAMGTFALAGAAVAFAGGLLGLAPWAAVPGLFVCALICSLVRVKGDTAALIGVLALTLFCIAEGAPAHLSASLLRAEMVVAGALFAIVLALAVWPFRPYGPVREAVAACWLQIGDVSAAAARLASSADASAWEELIPLRRRAREALEDARAALGVARAGRQGETGRGLQLLVLYEVAELLLGDLAALAETLRSRVERKGTVPPGIGGTLEALSAVHQELAQAIAERGTAPRKLDRPELAADPDLSALLERVTAETRHALEAAQALERGDAAGPAALGAVAPSDAAPSLRDALAPGSTELRHALRVALVATAAQVLATLLHLERSYWVTITVILVLQPHAVATVRRGLQRVGGTVIGGIVGAVIARWVRPPLAGYAILFALATTAVAIRRINYAAFATLITPVFVLLAETNAGAGHLTRVRILDTVLGGGLALVGALLLWPTRELERMPALIAAILRANRAYLAAVLGGQGAAAMVAARRRIGLATANAEAALQRLMSEAEPAALEPLMALVAYARRLSASITALASAPPPPPLAERLDQALTALADAAQEGAPPPPLPPLDDPRAPEPAQRLARQLRIVQSALARLA